MKAATLKKNHKDFEMNILTSPIEETKPMFLILSVGCI